MMWRRPIHLASAITGLLFATFAPVFAQADSHAGQQQDQSKANAAGTEPALTPVERPPVVLPVTDEARRRRSQTSRVRGTGSVDTLAVAFKAALDQLGRTKTSRQHGDLSRAVPKALLRAWLGIAQIERRNDDHVQQRGGGQAAEDHDRHRRLNLAA